MTGEWGMVLFGEQKCSQVFYVLTKGSPNRDMWINGWARNT